MEVKNISIQKTQIKGFPFLLILLGIFLNQSNVIMGVNLSIADFMLVIIVSLLLINKQLFLSSRQFLFFLFLSITVLISGSVINATLLESSIAISIFVKEYIKLAVLFLYLTLGYNLSRLKKIENLYNGFFWGSLIIAFLSLFYSVFPISAFRETLFFGGYRFRGLMNDPNYFSILQLVSLIYLLNNDKFNVYKKIGFSSIIMLSILFSGSKTGLINLGIIFLAILINKYFLRKKTYISILKVLLLIIIFFGAAYILFTSNLLERFSMVNPSFERIFEVFYDFDDALSGSGSGRGRAWNQAIELLKLSPFFGIGIGTYSNLNYVLSGERTIAHNTFLQLMVEWGSILSIVFFISVGVILFKAFKLKRNKNLNLSKCMMLPFILGSMSISLNNARLFWILLGAIYYFVQSYSKSSKNLNSNPMVE